jgi:ribose/xylose/arabinose/galactoside ABC-type transport system permease subunit
MIYAVGSNPEAARVTGVNVPAIRTLVYAIMGTITACLACSGSVNTPQPRVTPPSATK